MTHTRRIVLAVAVLPALIACPAGGQLSARQPGEGNVTTSMVPLAQKPVTLESGRVRFYPPAGSTWQRFRGTGNGSTQVTAEDQSWFINVQTPASSNTDQTAADVADAIVKQLMTPVTREKPALLGRERNLRVNGVPAERFYVRQPQPPRNNRAQPAIVRGYTVLPLEPGLFATFELVTTDPEFDRARRTFEVVVSTVEITDPTDEQAALADAESRARGFLAELTSEDYLTAINANAGEWRRLAEPATTNRLSDDRELSYRRVNARVGTRGELSRAGGTDVAQPANERGYLVGIDSRYLTPDQVIDSRGQFFMTPDREKEAWILTLTVRERGRPNSKPLIWVERGVRDDDAMRVRVKQSDGSTSAFDPTVDPAITLTQVERFLLGDLLVTSGANGAFAFQHWSSNTTAVTQRRDEIERSADGITISSVIGTDTREQITRFDTDGSFLSATLPAGAHQSPAIWTPITPERLTGIWRDKGLPID